MALIREAQTKEKPPELRRQNWRFFYSLSNLSLSMHCRSSIACTSGKLAVTLLVLFTAAARTGIIATNFRQAIDLRLVFGAIDGSGGSQ